MNGFQCSMMSKISQKLVLQSNDDRHLKNTKYYKHMFSTNTFCASKERFFILLIFMYDKFEGYP